MKKFFLPLLACSLAAGPALAQTTLNVRDADIRAFIADAAKVTGRSFIIDSRVAGKVTVVTDRPLSRSEYFEVFLSTLRANGLVAIPTAGGAFRVQPVDNAAQQPSRVGLAGAAKNSLVTEIVRLRTADAQGALDTVRPLVSAQGSVTANRAGNSLVVVDFADNVRRIRQVLSRLDGDTASTRVISLRNASAREIATALQGLAGGGTAGSVPAGGAASPAGGGQGVSIVAIESANAVALRGDPSTVARLAGVAAELDQKAQSGQQIRVVFLENADAAQLLPVLQQLVGQTPDPIPEATLSQTSFGQSGATTTSSGTGAFGQTRTPTIQPQAQSSTGGGQGGAVQPALTTQGGRTAAVVTRFAGANAIVIAAPADIQRQLSDVVRQLDTRREQVMVEAIVAEVSDATANQLGAQFLLGNPNGGAVAASTFADSAPNLLEIAGAIGAQSLATTTTSISNGVITTGTDTTITDQLAQSAITSLLSSSGGLGGFGTKIGDTIFGAIINAVKSDTSSNLLNVPHIITLDNQEAHSLVGQEIPITTGQALSTNFDNAFQTTQRENIGIGLDVRPQINASGSVKLNVHIEVSSIAGPVSSSNSDLILNKREVATTLTVDDGAIGVISGLLSDEERRTIEKIPVLGDLPGLGVLFRNRSTSRTKTNLMIFIRPVILRTPEDTRRLTEQRYGVLRLAEGQAIPNQEPSIDELVRDYMGAAPPLPPAPMPGSIEDARVPVPVVTTTTTQVRVKRR